jgi:hypothetical protein
MLNPLMIALGLLKERGIDPKYVESIVLLPRGAVEVNYVYPNGMVTRFTDRFAPGSIVKSERVGFSVDSTEVPPPARLNTPEASNIRDND